MAYLRELLFVNWIDEFEFKHFKQQQQHLTCDSTEDSTEELNRLEVNPNICWRVRFARALYDKVCSFSGLLMALCFALDMDSMAGDLFFPWLYADLFAGCSSVTSNSVPFPFANTVTLRGILRSDRVLQEAIELTIGPLNCCIHDGIHQYRPAHVVGVITRQLSRLVAAFHVLGCCCYEDERLAQLVGSALVTPHLETVI